MITGTYTALVTPFQADPVHVDYEGLSRLVDFQIQNGISGVLAVGTTGESPVLTWQEHHDVIEKVALQVRGKCRCIAGTGSNNTQEALEATRHAAGAGVDAVLLVDPYYNGPSSLEIRREYVSPVARAFPDLEIISYVIPGRTGAQILPEDLALLHRDFKNVSTVKEATADLENMRRTRTCCGPDFAILSGDDGLTFDMMADPDIRAAGVISVGSNIAPRAVADMVRLMVSGETEAARRLSQALTPIFNLVAVKTYESTPYGDVLCRARNPLPVKTLMAILGMPSGPCRPPLGKMSEKGIHVVLDAARKVWSETPDILEPAAEFFNIDIEARLNDPSLLKSLYYTGY